jgi:hypothetical protein|uniref:Uncharacterized protein n=1 Tax=Siphoviridae sp. ctD4R19 TaxID=2823568 RepID=A0A8S5L664_9CAUD|nr:MAG TPA: hypothetical protein [Siphoviridae sp. ctD4R19]
MKMNFKILNIDVRFSDYIINGKDRIIGSVYLENNKHIFIDSGLNQMTLRNHDDIRELIQKEKKQIETLVRDHINQENEKYNTHLP